MDRATESAPGTGTEVEPPSNDLVVRSLTIKGFVTPDALAATFGITEADAGSVLDRLTADGLAELAGAMFRLTDDGRALGAALIAADREKWGDQDAVDALDCCRQSDLVGYGAGGDQTLICRFKPVSGPVRS